VTDKTNPPLAAADPAWDHSTHPAFYEYYAEESSSERTVQRFRVLRDAILAVGQAGTPLRALDVADIGCGAGAHGMAWAELGHRVHALDINAPLLELGRKRAADAGYNIDFRLGAATELPWADASMDVCVALELLEHVADWQGCLREFVRILRPGGTLYLTTTNRLCPVQQEFNLPLYSWYPSRIKRRYERLASTTRPDLANFARYPAVTWFTFYSLRDVLARSGFQSLDRFDVMAARKKSGLPRWAVAAVRAVPPLRWLGHVCTPGTGILAIKQGLRP
jgi:2-polyprenyl-6-hydroxyphenyl methylase/3-demethylubiquinone-9 3-methyltransferase